MRIYKSFSLKTTTLYIRMKTKGDIVHIIDLEFEICGLEKVTLKTEEIEYEAIML